MSSRRLNLSASEAAAKDLVLSFSSRQIVLLSGGLGVGKTQWVQWMLREKGFASEGSPTYGVIHEISRPQNIQHVDLYRLESESEIESVGFWDLFEKETGLYFIEWPERISMELYPVDWDIVIVHLAHSSSDEVREVSILQDSKT